LPRCEKMLIHHAKLLLALSLILLSSSSNPAQAFVTHRVLLAEKTGGWSRNYCIDLSHVTLGECWTNLRASVGGTGTLVDTDNDSETVSALDWFFIDSVYLIHCPNGDPDGDRIASTRNILKDVNLLNSLTVKEFETDDEDRIRGCYNSHISVFRDIIEKNSEKSSSNGFDLLGIFKNERRDDVQVDDLNVLVFEDNLYLNNEILTQESINAISNFIQEYKNKWDVIHLAYIPYIPDLLVSKMDDKRIVRLSTKNKQSALGTTAYVINRRAMMKLIEEDDNRGYSVSIPDAMAELFGGSRYALNPTAFVRAPTTKSLVNPQLDELRSILFRPSVVSFVQQILITTGLSTTTLLPLMILFLLSTSITSISYSIHSAHEFLNYGTLDGPLIVPITSVVISLFSLGIIIQGILLAPKPNADENS